MLSYIHKCVKIICHTYFEYEHVHIPAGLIRFSRLSDLPCAMCRGDHCACIDSDQTQQ